MNRLQHEKSPYLLQHQHNPVDWYPWGSEAFASAKAQNKLIFLSIGYSTCYWCHVMEKDSFEREDVAEALNDNFIAIKVDREERPDVDQLYMDAVVAFSGHGGWPMSVFLTPDGKPVWGGTFFPRAQLLSILEQIGGAWKRDGERVTKSAEGIADALRERSIQGGSRRSIAEDSLKKAVASYEESFDRVWGGFGAAPKFPSSAALSFLLRMRRDTPSPQLDEMIQTSLTKMAYGGIYDHLGGGFARYSTDEKWHVPHFEKMLYDNALLIVTYLEAFQVYKTPLYEDVARESVEYVLREMKSNEGGFLSAQDAGEVGSEGEFYVWSEDEVRASLTSDEFSSFIKYFTVTSEGNFEHKNNVLTVQGDVWKERYHGDLASARKKLFEIRSRRPHPLCDDKIITSWNGLMILAMVKAYGVLKEKRYLDAAVHCAQFLRANLFIDGKLLRRYRDGDGRFDGCLEDYAFLIEALLALYQASGESEWYQWALTLQGIQDSIFWDEKDFGYRFSASKELFHQKKELFDNALPSGNSTALNNLYVLYSMSGEQRYLTRAEELQQALSLVIEKHPTACAKALHAYWCAPERARQIVIASGGESAKASGLFEEIATTFFPEALCFIKRGSEGVGDPPLLLGKDSLQGESAVYLCQGRTCEAPLINFDEVRRRLL